MTRDAKSRKKLRSRAAFEILRILAVEITGPILAAELGRLYLKSPPRRDVSLTKQNFYTILHRIAERGFIRLEGVRRRLTAVLTKEGERALAELEERHDVAELANVDLPAGAKLGVYRDDSNKFPVAHKIDASVRRRDAAHKLSRKSGLFYISYDLPKEFQFERRIMKDALRALGFQMLHESFYVGATSPALWPTRDGEIRLSAKPKSGASVSALILVAEKIGVLPFLSWGKMLPMSA